MEAMRIRPPRGHVAVIHGSVTRHTACKACAVTVTAPLCVTVASLLFWATDSWAQVPRMMGFNCRDGGASHERLMVVAPTR
jgi:hypothetical protein